MRRLLFRVAGLCLAPLVGLALAGASELDSKPAVPGPTVRPIKPVKPIAPEKGEGTCSAHGTQVEFFDTPSEAAKVAKKEQKLVFVLHVSGNFEDPRFTWNNAEALRVNALANAEVGKYLNEYFASSFQKVATFRIVGGQKQGGNVASYFCAPDGRILHVIAGPVNAATMLREAKWVVETTKKAMEHAKGDGGKFKAFFRKAHAERLKNEHGLSVEPVTFDPPVDDKDSVLTYRDPSGRPLAPKLTPPPLDGPDVTIREARALQAAEGKAAGARPVLDRRGRRWVLGNQGRVHMLLAAHCMNKIETLYATIFEGILGEKISTKPVEVVTPFPWVNQRGKGG